MNLIYQFALSHIGNACRFAMNRQWAVFFMLLFVVSCMKTNKVTPQPTNLPPITSSDTTPMQITLTPIPQPTETTIPTQTPTIPLATTQPTPSPTPEATSVNWAGQFWIYHDDDGIYRFNLETETSQLIVPILNQGTVWMSGATPTFNGQEIIYWFIEGAWFIVKAVNGITGQDRPLLTIEDNDFTSARGNWLGQGRFFELAIWAEDENGVPVVKQQYLFDISNDTIVGTADSDPGTKICYALAISPNSNRAAAWCSFEGQFDEAGNYVGRGEYFVIEAGGEYWVTTTPPDQVLVKTFGIVQMHNWSPAGNYVLVLGYLNPTLIDVDNSQVYDLFEKTDFSSNVSNVEFSPDGRFLSYEYDICCLRIIDLETWRVIWDSLGLFEPRPGIVEPLASILTWSPDGSYFVLRLSNGDYSIIETQNFSIVKSIARDKLLNARGVVWLNPLHN